MHSELCMEIGEGIEGMSVVEPTLILAVAAFDLTVVPGSIGADTFVPDIEISSRFLKEREAWTA